LATVQEHIKSVL